jgi:hypothetical protein
MALSRKRTVSAGARHLLGMQDGLVRNRKILRRGTNLSFGVVGQRCTPLRYVLPMLNFCRVPF